MNTFDLESLRIENDRLRMQCAELTVTLDQVAADLKFLHDDGGALIGDDAEARHFLLVIIGRIQLITLWAKQGEDSVN